MVSAAGDDARRPLPIPRLSAAAIAGGPEAWGDAGLRIAAWSEDGPRATPRSMFAAEARVAWSDRGIAVLLRMRSGVAWREAAEARSAFTADSLEIFLRAGPAPSPTAQAVISPGMAPDQAAARAEIWDYRGPHAAWSEVRTEVEVARTRTADGCDLVAVLPLRQLRATAERGVIIELRLQVNKVIPGLGRRQFAWRGPGGEDFHRLVLAEAPAEPVTTAGWACSADYVRLAIAAVAPLPWAGRMASVQQDGTVIASASLQADGDRAVMSADLPISALRSQAPLAIAVDGVLLGTSTIGDPQRTAARELELATLEVVKRYDAGWFQHLARVRPVVPVVLRRGILPEATAPDPAMLALAGMRAMRTRWFSRDGAEVTATAEPGRYAAVIELAMADGVPLQLRQTAVLLPERESSGDALLAAAAAASGDAQALGLQAALGEGLVGQRAPDREFAVLAAALDDARRDGAPLRPLARDQAWWHEQRRRLGTAARYPHFKLLPPDYGRDPAVRWPAIIYLHGSGGMVPRDYAPFAKRTANGDLLGWASGRGLPFAIYALQADGAWEPAAVLDAVDAICAEDRVDPERICIMGFSMGGIGSWDCAVDHPQRWSCVVPLGGRGYRADEADRVAALPAWSFNGDIDTSTTLADAQRMIDAIRAAGGEPRLTVLAGVDHGGTQTASFETPGLWEWIGLQRRRTQH